MKGPERKILHSVGAYQGRHQEGDAMLKKELERKGYFLIKHSTQQERQGLYGEE